MTTPTRLEDLESAIEEVSTRLKDLKSIIEEVSTDQKDLKSTNEEVSTHLKDLKSAIIEVSTHQKDLKSAIEEVSTHLNESNPSLKMSTPTEEVSREKGQVSADRKSNIEQVCTHLKESNYDHWISTVTKLAEWLYRFCDQHFPSTTQQRISDIERQIDLCIDVLESVPQVPDVYKEKAERYLVNATQLNPFLLEAWDCLALCVAKKGDYKRAKNCYKFVLKMGGESSRILRQIAHLELINARVPGNPAKHVDKCIKYAQRTLALDDKDGDILGCAYFTSFLLNGGWDHNNLQVAFGEYEKAMKIDAMKSSPYLQYDYSTVTRYLENYKESLIGFSDAAVKNPASDASHQVKVTVQLLDKLIELLQGKHKDKSKGKNKRKSKRKSTETSLSSLIQSLANIDLNPSYKRATVDLLTEGFNEQIEVVAAVRCLVKYEYKAPVYYMLCDSDENSFVLAVFGIQKEAIKQGDQVTLLDPICKFVDFEWEGKHYEFKSVRVNLLEQVLVNGNPLPPSSAMRDSIMQN
uniref:Tetratricopeptide repeat protein 5 OB fold domain-containing protein n=1 Tax=Solanum lycopersicum TaxID=4081 RepID=K4B5W2_SOLLC